MRALTSWFCGVISPGVLNPSDSFSSFFLSSCRISELRGKEPDGDLQFVLSLHLMIGCGSLHLLSSTTRRSLCSYVFSRIPHALIWWKCRLYKLIKKKKKETCSIDAIHTWDKMLFESKDALWKVKHPSEKGSWSNIEQWTNLIWQHGTAVYRVQSCSGIWYFSCLRVLYSTFWYCAI